MNEAASESRGSEPVDAEDAPYISADTNLPEITVKAAILAVVLSILLAGANTYLGLFAGMTVSASIPAAVISMAILKLFKNSNILENNIVQTSASAGESLAAGVIFTIPALVILKAWTEFGWVEVTLISGLGGLLGVLFTIPLRRALIVENPLRFPEGVATAEVLKVGDKGGAGIAQIAIGGAIGAVFKFGASALHLFGETFEGAFRIGGGTRGSIGYFGTNLSPALIGVGYIVGLNIAVLVFVGGAINWLVAIPAFAGGMEWPVYQSAAEVANPAWNQFVTDKADLIGSAVSASDWAWQIWSKQTRYIGVGSMVVGGLWALIKLRTSLMQGIRSSLAAYREMRAGGEAAKRTERDAPMQFVGIAFALSAIPLFIVFEMFTHSFLVAGVMAVAMLIAGFLFSAVASYMAGLVGSSNNPISGVTIATILTSALLLLLLSRAGWMDGAIGASAAILIGAVVCCAAAIGGDNMQDLKAGRIVGATPYKQQIMQAVGVISASVVMAPVLALLQKAYGIGIATPEHPKPLAAPQATLMASVAGGVFGDGLPVNMILIGAAIAVAVIVLDVVLEKRGSSFRTPVLAVAVGIYLPFELSVPIFIGGLIAWASQRIFKKKEEAGVDVSEAKVTGAREGLLFSSGLITGEALMGILIAVLIVLQTGPEFDFLGMHIAIPKFTLSLPALLGLEREVAVPALGVILLLAVIGSLYWVATAALRKSDQAKT